MVSFASVSSNALAVISLTVFAGHALAAPVDSWLAPGGSFQKREGGGIKLDFEVRLGPRNVTSTGISTGKREVSTELFNKGVYYSAQIGFGSDDQIAYLDLDTGSSDLWVVATNASCYYSPGQPKDYCTQQSTYNPSLSTTDKVLNQSILLAVYGSGFCLGDFHVDDIHFGGITLKNAQFGLALLTSIPTGGIIGIGFDNSEATNKRYPNLPDTLVSQGFIERNYYSLYLDSPTSKTGSIIFGGIDESKYTGDLVAVDIVLPDRLAVNLVSVSTNNSTTVGKAVTILDSGTTISLFPNALADSLASHFENAKFSSADGVYRAGCKIPEGTFTFNFENNAIVEVPFSSFLLEQDGDVCYLGIGHQVDGGNGTYLSILGDNFLSSAYVVYDLSEMTISLAQSKW